MKWISFLFLPLFLSFISCNSIAKSDNEEESQSEILYEKAMKSDMLTDSIFMDFKFGMTEKEFSKHAKVLVNKGMASIKYDEFKCHFKDTHGFKYTARLAPEYYQGKLFRLTLLIETDGLIATTGNEYVLLFSAFRDTHKDYDWTIEKDYADNPIYIITKNNLVITFKQGIGDNRIIYENAPIAPLYEKEKQIQDSIEFSKIF